MGPCGGQKELLPLSPCSANLHLSETILRQVTEEVSTPRLSLYVLSPCLLLFSLALMMLSVRHSTTWSVLHVTLIAKSDVVPDSPLTAGLTADQEKTFPALCPR